MGILFEKYKRHLTEAKAAGSDALNGAATQATMAKEVWAVGLPSFREIFAKRVLLEAGKTQHVFPVTSTLTATDNYGAANVTFMSMSYVTCTADKSKGINVGWTREYIEMATWDAIAALLKEAGRALEEIIFTTTIAEAYNAAGTTDLDAPDNYAAFLAGVAALAALNYECDVVIVHPTQYFALLGDEKFISVAVMGSDDPIQSGKIRTTLGVTLFSSTLIAENTAIWLDSKKAIAMVESRERKVEEYSYPDANLYGFVISTVFGEKTIIANAVASTKAAE